jgi:hypothetical protein
LSRHWYNLIYLSCVVCIITKVEKTLLIFQTNLVTLPQ